MAGGVVQLLSSSAIRMTIVCFIPMPPFYGLSRSGQARGKQ